jgi:hypothetical protein
MKKLMVFAMITLAYVIVSCSKDEDPTPQDLVTYTLEVNQDWWMFANGPDGKVLDHKQLVFDQPVKLTVANPPDSFSLSILRVLGDGALLEITTYGGIKPGAVYTPKVFDSSDSEEQVSTGKSTVQVINYSSTQTLPFIIADPYQSTTYTGKGSSTITFLMKVWRDVKPQFFFGGYVDDYTKPVYKFIDPVEPGSTATADFSSFTPYDKTVDLESFTSQGNSRLYFEMSGISTGDETDYKLASFFLDYKGEPPPIKIGYLESIARYNIQAAAYETDPVDKSKVKRALTFNSVGAVPSEMKFMHDDLSISNRTIGAFEFTFSGRYHSKAAFFKTSTAASQVNWTVYSATGVSIPITEVPSELSSKYSALNLASMQLSSVAFYTYLDDFNYLKFVESKFTTSYGPEHPGYAQQFF